MHTTPLTAPSTAAYLERVGVQVPSGALPTRALLSTLLTAHLSTVPFENLSLHCEGQPINLSLPAIEDKVIHRRRGGFCFELNLLFAHLLRSLGYEVRIVPAQVHAPSGLRPTPTHIFLLVSGVHAEEAEFFVDVGFGEPPMEPLRYQIGAEQATTEGMRSRFVYTQNTAAAAKPPPNSNSTPNPNPNAAADADADVDVAVGVGGVNAGRGPAVGVERAVELQWLVDGEWMSRLRWQERDTAPSVSLPQPEVERLCAGVTGGSSFTQKVVVCRLSTNEKLTLAGLTLKRTTPRFGPEVARTLTQLESVEEVREALHTHFGITPEETHTLDLTASSAAEASLWSNF